MTCSSTLSAFNVNQHLAATHPRCCSPPAPEETPSKHRRPHSFPLEARQHRHRWRSRARRSRLPAPSSLVNPTSSNGLVSCLQKIHHFYVDLLPKANLGSCTSSLCRTRRPFLNRNQIASIHWQSSRGGENRGEQEWRQRQGETKAGGALEGRGGL